MTQHIGQPTGQQMTQGPAGGTQGITGRTQGAVQQGGRLPQQRRDALHSVAQAVQVCGWCADQCIQEANPSMIECIRLCEDVVELGETLLALAPRSSRSTGQVVQVFQQAAEACRQECGRHQAAHCQECASVLQDAAVACQQLGATTDAGGAAGSMTQ